MKKICFFVGNVNLSGGTERVSSVIINELHQAGYEVHVVNLSGGDKPFFQLDSAVISSSLENVQGGGLKAFCSSVVGLHRYLKRNAIGTLVVVESMLALYAVPATRLLGLQLIIWEHFNFHVDLGRRSRRFARHLAAISADHVITLTERDKSNWQRIAWCRAEIVAINNPTTFEKSDNFPVLSNKRLLSVGRLTDQKGFDLLLHAFGQITNNPALDGWSLDIVGSGAKLDELLKIRDELCLNKRVNFIPSTNDIRAHYASASIYIMSSRFEGFPMVLLEAMSHGLPVIAFDCETGPREMVVQNVTGWLVEPANVAMLSKQIVESVLTLSMGSNYSTMVNRVFEHSKGFDVNAFVSKWLSLLK